MTEKALKRQRLVWVQEAEKYGADLDRVQVWDALSELFLDSFRTDEEQDWLAEIIADTPFSFSELGHILFCEVGPVCFPNTLCWVGGEGLGFSSDWLIPRCLSRQKKSVYSANAKPDELPVWMHLASPLYLEAYLLIYRVKRLRTAR